MPLTSDRDSIPNFATIPIFCGIILYLFLSVVFHAISLRYSLSGMPRINYSSYDSPHVWIMAVLMLLVFDEWVKIPKWLGKIINWMAPSMFGIYLLHDTTCFGKDIYRIPEFWISKNTCLHPFLIIVICSVWTYMVAFTVDVVRRVFVKSAVSLARRTGIDKNLSFV